MNNARLVKASRVSLWQMAHGELDDFSPSTPLHNLLTSDSKFANRHASVHL